MINLLVVAVVLFGVLSIINHYALAKQERAIITYGRVLLTMCYIHSGKDLPADLKVGGKMGFLS